MEMEHNSDLPFVTPNYNITTCPLNEWKIVINIDKSKETPYGRHHRTIPNWKEIVRKEKMQAQKGKEALLTDAPLTDVEVIAIILYTGPMVRTPLLKQRISL